MKPWQPVSVVWFDAHGGDQGWTGLDMGHYTPETITSVGMLAHESRAGVTLVLSRMEGKDPNVAGYLFIPRPNIVALTKLVPKTPKENT